MNTSSDQRTTSHGLVDLLVDKKMLVPKFDVLRWLTQGNQLLVELFEFITHAALDTPRNDA
jgi:hypothetical protein